MLLTFEIRRFTDCIIVMQIIPEFYNYLSVFQIHFAGTQHGSNHCELSRHGST